MWHQKRTILACIPTQQQFYLLAYDDVYLNNKDKVWGQWYWIIQHLGEFYRWNAISFTYAC